MADDDAPTLVYVTASSREEAENLGRAAVEARLAACANVLGAVTSFFWWEGKVQAEGESSLILKTRRSLVPALTAHIKGLHSYTVPCVVALPILDGNPDFLRWIADETRG